jgi:D-amino peptidase
MKKTAMVLCLIIIMAAGSGAAGEKSLKVFISVDMEGISGVVVSAECRQGGRDYQYFRKIMTLETNAAIEGALAAGATEILVRDSHGSALNIIPDLLHHRARLLRNWSGGFLGMMEGIDNTFDAVMFIGYHARAGTPNAIIDHTSSGSVMDMSVNGISLPEAGYNALVAGHFGVPVVFLAGDQAICDQVKKLFGNVETVAVKQGIGEASLGIHPQVARTRIQQGVTRALKNLKKYTPFKMKPPYKLVLKLKSERMVYRGSFYPGAKRTGPWELTFTSDSILEIVKAFSRMRY